MKVTKLRPDLPALPARMRHLPVSAAGYPVPWFVSWVNGQPEFRCVEPGRITLALKRKLCWVCGKPLTKTLAFVLGPMCAVNRTNAEPACHVDCAKFSAMACPFLTRPAMERRDDNMPAGTGDPPGFAIMRNPGVCGVWITDHFNLFSDGQGGMLFRVGPPQDVLWYCQGRPATRDEVLASINSGLPILEGLAREDGGHSLAALNVQVKNTLELLPA